VNSIGPAREYSASSTASATIFVQGDAATSVMYVEEGVVRLSVLSHAGKEAVVAVVDGGHFVGEGLPGRPAAADGHCDGDGAVHDRGRR
jgi:CRP-like cAMP-binding protein